MSQIHKTIELTGESPESFEDAIRSAVARASASVDAVRSFEVLALSGKLDPSGVPVFNVTLNVSFDVKEALPHG